MKFMFKIKTSTDIDFINFAWILIKIKKKMIHHISYKQ